MEKKKQLELEIEHILESGSNTIRLVELFQRLLSDKWIPIAKELPPFNTPVMLRGVISWKTINSVSYFSDEVQIDSEILEYGHSGYTLKFNSDYLVCGHPNPEEIMSEYITHWQPLIEPTP
jgi:hypothetical protein